jgi:uncharacterized protein with ATP-grasp and redox domains
MAQMLRAQCWRIAAQNFAAALRMLTMIIAKGQGNFESLSDQPGNLFYLFKVKCPLVANHIRQPVGTQVLLHSGIHLDYCW